MPWKLGDRLKRVTSPTRSSAPMSVGNAFTSARICSRAQASIFFFTYRSDAALLPTSTMASVGTSLWRSISSGTAARTRASIASATGLPSMTTGGFPVGVIGSLLAGDEGAGLGGPLRRPTRSRRFSLFSHSYDSRSMSASGTGR